MMPVYMNSSQPGQMRPQGHYHQGFGKYPQHMTMDASSPMLSEQWPAPTPCYGSCVHGNFPAYNAYWPPCYPSQVPYHPCYMNYTGFHPHAPYYTHQPFPTGYQPWYGSEKDVCTKCSPQSFHPKNDKSIVIEEHEPEIEKGDNGKSVNPFRSTKFSHPIMWIPHEDSKNQEHGSSPVSAELEVPESMKLQRSDPKSRNGCFPLDDNTMKSLIQKLGKEKMQNGNTVELPFDISKLKSLLQCQEGKEEQIQKNKESGQLPYPIFWIPSLGKQEDISASENEGRSLKSLPSDINVNDGQITQQKGEEGNFEAKVPSGAGEKSSLRDIPVESRLQEPRNIPVKLSENYLPIPTEPTKKIAKTEPVEKTKKEQPSCPAKATRLPPVCLRVDPFPRRKNGGSKSLSPPRRREQPLTSEETKVASTLSSKKAQSKAVAEACNVRCEEANKEKMSEGTENKSVENNSNLQEANCDIVEPYETKENRDKPAKKTFTGEEAGRIIQSWYRGYDVRRWEPLKKLKEIATVRQQMGDVKKRIEALKVSTNQHNEGKEVLILEEMVMSLLLKLDSVQGLHRSIRDYRKSLAKELSDIQEKLDSMRKSSALAETETVKEQVVIPSQTSDSLVSSEYSEPAEEKMESSSNTEIVLPSSGEHSMNITVKTLSEVEVGSGVYETPVMDRQPDTETGRCKAVDTSAAVSENIEEVENVVPTNPLSVDENGMTVTNAVVVSLEEPPQVMGSSEEPPQVVGSLEEPRQVVETSMGFKGTENATGASATESIEKKEDDDTISLSEKEVVYVEKASQEETEVEQETFQTEEQESRETEEMKEVRAEETKRLIEENQRFKETMESLVKAGKEQLQVISKLTGRVKSLENKLLQKKKTQVRRRKKSKQAGNQTKPNQTQMSL